MNTVPVRCPRCAAVFDLPPDRLGRNVRCPQCEGPLTARPLALEARLCRRQASATGGAGRTRDTLPLAVLVDGVRSLWNVGSIFRTADAFGVREIVLSGITGCPPDPRIAKTALGAEDVVAWRYRADVQVAAHELQQAGYDLVALETTARAVPLPAVRWPERPALVLGNEVAGVSPPLLESCPLHVSIPMRGVKESLNVAVAFGIVAQTVAYALGAGDRPRAQEGEQHAFVTEP